jgi:glycosyltransferase involved in cell wall biosynthesis
MIGRTGGGLLAASERPADIADAIYTLWRDREHAAALSQRGVHGVRAHYTIDLMADRTLDVYRELVENRAARESSHQTVSVSRR